MSAAAVIVPAANAARTLGDTLAALAAQDFGEPYEVIVVDDGSEDGTAAVAEAAGGPVRLVRQRRLGASAARNRGVAEASAPLLAFTDADCVPTRGWLRAGVAGLERSELVQGAVRADPAAEPGPFDRTLWVTHETGYYETASLFVRIGGFVPLFPDADLGRPMGEDTWFGWRARRAGARTEFCAGAVVHHEVVPRGAGEYVAERLRLREFPALARRIPELRTHNFFARHLLSPRSAAFDAAVAGIAVAALTSYGARRTGGASARPPWRWRAWRPTRWASQPWRAAAWRHARCSCRARTPSASQRGSDPL
jgi:glycosyltransferase involved in cell wall biosynthesis